MRRYVLAIAVTALLVYGAATFFVSRISASHVVSTIRIHREMADVFDFFTTPKNWPRWHPASISVAGATDHSLAIGEEVTEEFRTGSGKGRTVWRVTARDAPHLWRIENSPAGDAWVTITYRLRMEGSDTVFERDMQYQMGTYLPHFGRPRDTFAGWHDVQRCRISIREVLVCMLLYGPIRGRGRNSSSTYSISAKQT